jgi:hypothetical protein
MAKREQANRRLGKATYQPFELELPSGAEPQRALDKAALVHALAPTPAEVASVVEREGLPGDWIARLSGYSAPAVPGDLPPPSTVAPLPAEMLLRFARGIVTTRREALTATGDGVDPATGGVAADVVVGAAGGPAISVRGEQLARLHQAQAATINFGEMLKVSPIGLLHLERVEMMPAGLTRGELVGTVPLAPRETVAVATKEWSIVTSGFETIVTDVLEEVSEKGVTEKNELTQSSESQTKHASQLNLEAAIWGSYGFVSFATKATQNIARSSEESAKTSRNHAIEVTRKASTRSKKEHKVTVSTTTVTGREQTNTRTITNPSDANALRIDYFSILRKWHVQLYRYGLRLTYDIGVPEPASELRRAHAELTRLESLLATPFEFGLDPNTIHPGNYLAHARLYNASVPPPPAGSVIQRVGGPVDLSGLDGDDWRFFELDVNVPDGYVIGDALVDAMIGRHPQAGARSFIVFGVGEPWAARLAAGDASVVDSVNQPGFLVGRSGAQKIVYRLVGANIAAVTFVLRMDVTAEAMNRWRMDAWRALREAARDAYVAAQQSTAARIEALRARLADVDTLTLRREEREEIMRGVLRWLLGPAFEFMPKEVLQMFGSNPLTLLTGTGFTGNQLPIDSKQWNAMFRYQEMVKFIQHAIEWENLLYFLYPYFWDMPPAWDFLRGLQHPDPTRQSFLRAGSARVVLTIRPGYEEAFTAFVEQGELGKVLPPTHPYLTIGQELRAYAQTNYPGIPAANPSDAQAMDTVNLRERGQLVAEWFEYTPSPGIDIALDSVLPDEV